jgi:hypothetical protein
MLLERADLIYLTYFSKGEVCRRCTLHVDLPGDDSVSEGYTTLVYNISESDTVNRL